MVDIEERPEDFEVRLSGDDIVLEETEREKLIQTINFVTQRGLKTDARVTISG